jgi:hypothetical protein
MNAGTSQVTKWPLYDEVTQKAIFPTDKNRRDCPRRHLANPFFQKWNTMKTTPKPKSRKPQNNIRISQVGFEVLTAVVMKNFRI